MTDPSFPSAHELDRVMREHPERLAELAQHTPTWLADQLRSAARDAHRSATAIPGATVAGEPPTWLRLAALSTLLTWTNGTGTTCEHHPRIERPEPVVAAAWRPDTVTCRTCADVTFTEGISDDDAQRCDGCGTTPSSGLHPGHLAIGPLLMFYAMCVRCRDSGRSGTR